MRIKTEKKVYGEGTDSASPPLGGSHENFNVPKSPETLKNSSFLIPR